MAGTVNIEGMITGLSIGSVQINVAPIIPNSANDYQQLVIFIHAGNNTIAVPTWAAGVLVIPPATNASTLTLQGNAVDTGIAISPSGPFLLTFPSTPPGSFNLLAGADVTGGAVVFTYF